jgi:arginine/lysine/ornithine decarboxylase
MSDGSDDYASMVAVAALGYVWFLFSTKMDIHLNIIIIMLLLGSVIYDSKTKKENNQIEDDKNITDHMKDSLIAQNDKNGKYVMFGIMGIIVSFMLLYSNKKEVQHGGGYSAVNFLLY